MPRYIQAMDDVLSPDVCKRLIAGFRADKRVAPDPQPEYSRRRYLYLSDKPDWKELNAAATRAALLVMERYFEILGCGPEEWLDDGWVLARYAPGDRCALHDDGQCAEESRNGLRLATLLFYLNDAPGGETFFPAQDVRVRPVQGRAVVFPPWYTHPHEVLPCGGERFILQTWITDTELKVVQR